MVVGLRAARRHREALGALLEGELLEVLQPDDVRIARLEPPERLVDVLEIQARAGDAR
jgi:hypothetical protein